MFLPIRPSQLAIDRFLRNSEKLPLSYDPVGIAMSGRHRGDRDEQVVAIGSGRKDFEQARRALMSWKHYDMNWVTVYPQRAGVSVGAVVAVPHPPSRVLVAERMPTPVHRRRRFG